MSSRWSGRARGMICSSRWGQHNQIHARRSDSAGGRLSVHHSTLPSLTPMTLPNKTVTALTRSSSWSKSAMSRHRTSRGVESRLGTVSIRDNGPTLSGRRGAPSQLQNHKDRGARPARCNGWLTCSRIGRRDVKRLYVVVDSRRLRPGPVLDPLHRLHDIAARISINEQPSATRHVDVEPTRGRAHGKLRRIKQLVAGASRNGFCLWPGLPEGDRRSRRDVWVWAAALSASAKQGDDDDDGNEPHDAANGPTFDALDVAPAATRVPGSVKKPSMARFYMGRDHGAGTLSGRVVGVGPSRVSAGALLPPATATSSITPSAASRLTCDWLYRTTASA